MNKTMKKFHVLVAVTRYEELEEKPIVKVCPNCGNNDMLQTVYLVPDEISKLYDED